MNNADDKNAALAALDAKYGALYAAAIRREAELRALAFQRHFVIAGVPIRAVTLADWRLHVESKNCLFNAHADRTHLADDCRRFLWLQYTGRRDHWLPRKRFWRRLHRLPGALIQREVLEHLEMLYLDRLELRQPAVAEAHASYEASCIDLLAARYGWTVDYILAMPLAAIRQFENIILAELLRQNKETPRYLGLKSAKIKGRWAALKLQILNQTVTATS